MKETKRQVRSDAGNTFSRLALCAALLVSCGSAVGRERVILPGCDFEVTMPVGSWRKTYGEWEAVKSPPELLPTIDARCMRFTETLSQEGKLAVAGILAHKTIQAFRLTDAAVSRHTRDGHGEIRFHGKMMDSGGVEWVVVGAIAAGPNSLMAVTLTGLLDQQPPTDVARVFQSVRLIGRR